MTNYRVMEGEALVQWGNEWLSKTRCPWERTPLTLGSEMRRKTPYSWLDLPRRPRTYRSVPGENPVVCARKFCSACGRWRLLMEFGVGRYDENLEPLYYQSQCRTCVRLRLRARRGYAGPQKLGRRTKRQDTARRRELYRQRRQRAEWVERRREFDRIYTQTKRRENGIRARNWSPGGGRDKGAKFKGDAVDSGPFIAWLDEWQAHQASQRTFGMDPANYCPSAGLGDLADLAGCSVKAFWRARHEGRITISLVDRVLIAAGGSTMLIDLYPQLYPDVEWVA